MAFCWGWVKHIWFEFRQGHGIYLSFIPSFVNFILLTYNFLIVPNSSLSFLSNIVLYSVLLVALYVPCGVVVGRLHNKRQLPIEMTVQADSNPYWKLLFTRLDCLEKKIEALEAGK